MHGNPIRSSPFSYYIPLHHTYNPSTPKAYLSHMARRLPLRLQPIHPPRLLRLRSNTESMPEPFLRIVHVIVRDGRVGRDAIVPERHGAVVPADTDLEVLALGDVLAACQKENLCISDRGAGGKLWLTLNRSFRIASDSSSFSPTMRFVKPGLTKRAFWPVTFIHPVTSDNSSTRGMYRQGQPTG